MIAGAGWARAAGWHNIALAQPAAGADSGVGLPIHFRRWTPGFCCRFVRGRC